jgi:hypothetical protein
MSDGSLTTAEDGSTRLSARRTQVCLYATYQIESLVRLLPGLIPETDETFSGVHALRGIAGRIAELNSVLMSGLGEDTMSARELDCTVNITPQEVVHV